MSPEVLSFILICVLRLHSFPGKFLLFLQTESTCYLICGIGKEFGMVHYVTTLVTKLFSLPPVLPPSLSLSLPLSLVM